MGETTPVPEPREGGVGLGVCTCVCTRMQASPEREGATIVELNPLWSPAGLGPVLFFLPFSVNQEQVWPCQKVWGPRHGMVRPAGWCGPEGAPGGRDMLLGPFPHCACP